MTFKRCSRCFGSFPADTFPLKYDRRRPAARRSICKACKGRLENARVRAYAPLLLISRPRPDACELCGRAVRLVADHSHRSGVFRGWICYRCNRALARVGDEPGPVGKLFEYLLAAEEDLARQIALVPARRRSGRPDHVGHATRMLERWTHGASVTADALGISVRSLQRWKQLASQGHEPYAQFIKRLEQLTEAARTRSDSRD